MRILIAGVFFGVISVLSKEEHQNNYFNAVLEKGTHLTSYNEFDRNHYGFVNDLNNVFRILRKLEKLDNSLLEGDSILDFEAFQKQIDYLGLGKDVDVLGLFRSFFPKCNNPEECAELLNSYRADLNTASAEGEVKDKSKDSSLDEDACKKLLKYLKKLCLIVKKEFESNNDFSKLKCSELQQKCLDLQDICDDVLSVICKNTKDKCDELHRPVVKFTRTHTVLVKATSLVTELLPGAGTYTETFIKTETCCLGREPILTESQTEEPEPTQCSITETEHVTVTITPVPEGESPSESGDSSGGHEGEHEIPVNNHECPATVTLTETVVYTPDSGDGHYEGSSEEDSGHEEPSKDGESGPEESPEDTVSVDSECSVTVTLTTGCEVTSEVEDKGSGVRLDGFQRTGIICLIIGITTGIWIFV